MIAHRVHDHDWSSSGSAAANQSLIESVIEDSYVVEESGIIAQQIGVSKTGSGLCTT